MLTFDRTIKRRNDVMRMLKIDPHDSKSIRDKGADRPTVATVSRTFKGWIVYIHDLDQLI